MLLLDTDVLIELRRSRPNAAVHAWMLAQDPAEIFIAAVSIGEIQRGIDAARKHGEAEGAERDKWLDDLCRTHQVIAADAPIMRIWARLAGARAAERSNDALIAATALHHGLTVATRNTKVFLPYGVLVTNPWRAAR